MYIARWYQRHLQQYLRKVKSTFENLIWVRPFVSAAASVSRPYFLRRIFVHFMSAFVVFRDSISKSDGI